MRKELLHLRGRLTLLLCPLLLLLLLLLLLISLLALSLTAPTTAVAARASPTTGFALLHILRVNGATNLPRTTVQPVLGARVLQSTDIIIVVVIVPAAVATTVAATAS